MELKFEEDKALPSFSLPQAALNITWEDQILFVATKKAFLLVNALGGEIKQKIEHGISVSNPLIAVS